MCVCVCVWWRREEVLVDILNTSSDYQAVTCPCWVKRFCGKALWPLIIGSGCHLYLHVHCLIQGPWVHTDREENTVSLAGALEWPQLETDSQSFNDTWVSSTTFSFSATFSTVYHVLLPETLSVWHEISWLSCPLTDHSFISTWIPLVTLMSYSQTSPRLSFWVLFLFTFISLMFSPIPI